MLVLTRKLFERILIGGEIEITIVKIDRKQVRIAIKAPDHVKIIRAELCAAFESEDTEGDWS